MGVHKSWPRLFSIILVVAFTTQAATVPTNFKWRAHLNRDTGIATSCEESTAVFPVSEAISPHQISEAAKRIIQEYPKFLSRPSLTFGLLKTKHTTGKQSDLCTSMYNLKLLSFGYSKHTSRTICNRIVRRYSPGSNTMVILCSFETPILGGLLSQSYGHDKGCLRFTLLRNESNSKQHHELHAVFVTEIDGPYKPSLAGTSLPRSRIKSAVYCATQRMFHEYVMWRFHRLFTKELNDCLKS